MGKDDGNEIGARVGPSTNLFVHDAQPDEGFIGWIAEEGVECHFFSLGTAERLLLYVRS